MKLSTKPLFVMLVGLPGSGKSTTAKHYSDLVHNCEVFSYDSIRKELFGSEECQKDGEKVFYLLHKRIKDFLISHKNDNAIAIYDACNISYKRRMAFLKELKNIECEKQCIVIWKPYDKCMEHNQSRNRVVPDYALKRMYKNFYFPNYYEGWDSIKIYHEQTEIKNTDIFEKFYDEYCGLVHVDHENPHHTFSVGDHCISCYLNVLNHTLKHPDRNLEIAALLHDIGKPFVKEFLDGKGNESSSAHYYQHHLISAYDAAGYICDLSLKDQLEILSLIQWHMIPYFWEKTNNEKMRNKYKKLLGNDLYEKVMILHDADIKAH